MLQLALGLQGLHQALERQLLVGQCLAAALFDLVQHAAEWLLTVELAAHDQGVDKTADQPFGLDPGAVGHRHADAQVSLPAEAVQQHIEGAQ